MTLAAIRLIHCRLLVALIFVPSVEFAATNSAWLTRTWQTEEGLPNNYINSIAQGQDGYLWLATRVALVKFDGIHFTEFPFRSFNESDYQNQGARHLVTSRDGGLWITPLRGPAVYLNPDHSQVSPPETGLPPDASPSTSVEDHEGAYWIATVRTIVRIKNGQAAQFGEREGVSKGAVYALTPDAAGKIWLAKGGGIYVFNQGRFEEVARVDGVARIGPARTNGVWIANREHLFHCDDGGRLQDFGSFQPDNPPAGISALMQDHAGAVWIGTDGNGLFRHSDSGFEKVDTSHPKILSLMEDEENNLWVGTAGGGLNRISPRGVQMEAMAFGSSLVGIQSVCEDIHGVLWGATQSGLLVTRRNNKWIAPFTNELGTVTRVAADRNGSVWIGTRDSGLYCWRDDHFTNWNPTNALAGASIGALLPDSTGDLWIGEYRSNAVQCLHKGILRTLTSSREIGKINAMAEDSTGDVWIGTDFGLLRAEGNQLVDETPRTEAINRVIRSLYATPDGTLWIGYGGWGLGRLQDKHFARLNDNQGLPDDYVSQIIADDQGWLWFGSAEHGIFKIRQQQLEQAMADQTTRLRPILYGRNEGLSSPETFGVSPGAMRSSDGRLWIPMRTALAVVDPQVLHENPKPPTALLTSVNLDGRNIATYGGVISTQRLVNLKTLDAPLHLPPMHRRLEIDFTALNFSAPENVHLQYQLEGFDNNWMDAEPQRNASYPRLAAGNYKFRLRACNADGIWNEAVTTLGFIVAPVFWQTWWFRFIALALFTTTLVGTVRYVSFRRLRLKMRILEQQAALEKERTRIARDLHDDLGCSLTKIVTLSELMLRDRAVPDKVGTHAQQTSLTARHVIKSLDETVWVLNPRNDTLPHLINYISQFAVEFLRTAGIRCQVDLPDHPPELLVSAEARHNLFLAVQEALNNVVRHAHASEVQFHASVTGESLTLTIKDNGQGFERVPDDAGADGLRNMRQRMEESGGRFQMESRPGAGTQITLTHHWPQRE